MPLPLACLEQCQKATNRHDWSSENVLAPPDHIFLSDEEIWGLAKEPVPKSHPPQGMVRRNLEHEIRHDAFAINWIANTARCNSLVGTRQNLVNAQQDANKDRRVLKFLTERYTTLAKLWNEHDYSRNGCSNLAGFYPMVADTVVPEHDELETCRTEHAIAEFLLPHLSSLTDRSSAAPEKPYLSTLSSGLSLTLSSHSSLLAPSRSNYSANRLNFSKPATTEICDRALKSVVMVLYLNTKRHGER
ncbi:hypothetical protein QBC36DRAFT_363272 [Triangularia setosa]|uniref:Uncharacterized protein n=1 Tax=Triangularia setosa TaxID=2587417 RepID=A0AAN7A3R4_9PEZI|nr:hypothetical protein QBC36DRAFT_363272 [Podospora setosa]